MSRHVRLPGTLLQYVGHSGALTYDASTVRDALSMLVREYPRPDDRLDVLTAIAGG